MMVTKHSELDNNRDARLAMLMHHKWKAEIERAVDRVKNYKKCTTQDKWFRKKWFIAQARDRKKRAGEKQGSNYGNSLKNRRIANRVVRPEEQKWNKTRQYRKKSRGCCR